MVSMFLHRRDVLSYYEAPAPTGPLYPFPTIEDGPLAGTGGQRVVYYNTSSKYAGVYNNKLGNTPNAGYSAPTLFTIPAGASYVLTVEIAELSTTLNNAGFYQRYSGSTKVINLQKPNGANITTTGTYTITGTVESDAEVGEFGFNLKKGVNVESVSCDMTITLTVNGVRYI